MFYCHGLLYTRRQVGAGHKRVLRTDLMFADEAATRRLLLVVAVLLADTLFFAFLVLAFLFLAFVVLVVVVALEAIGAVIVGGAWVACVAGLCACDEGEQCRDGE